jgi:hypothetical protein
MRLRSERCRFSRLSFLRLVTSMGAFSYPFGWRRN